MNGNIGKNIITKRIGDTISWNGVNKPISGVIDGIRVQYRVRLQNGASMVVDSRSVIEKEGL